MLADPHINSGLLLCSYFVLPVLVIALLLQIVWYRQHKKARMPFVQDLGNGEDAGSFSGENIMCHEEECAGKFYSHQVFPYQLKPFHFSF